MRRLKGKAAVKMTEAVLEFARNRPAWTMGHDTRRDHYPLTPVDSVYLWAVKRYGRVDTTLGPKSVEQAVGPQLEEQGQLLPVARLAPSDARLLGLPEALVDLSPELGMRVSWQLRNLRVQRRFSLGFTYAQRSQGSPPRRKYAAGVATSGRRRRLLM